MIINIKTSEKARYIAKSTLYNSPCVNCPNSQVKPMWYGVYNRIFPEEVSNVNKYLNSNFTAILCFFQI